MMKILVKIFSLMGLLLLSSMASAVNWQVDNAQSQLSFVSVKKNDIAEVHYFDRIVGTVSETGELAVKIDLSSVNTGIEIRDSRMKAFFFEIDTYPSAELSATVDPALIKELSVGQSRPLTLDAQLGLHGHKKAISLALVISKISDEKLLVISRQPLILNVSDFDLLKGLEKLKELAGLPSISQAVPVSFYMTLTAM